MAWPALMAGCASTGRALVSYPVKSWLWLNCQHPVATWADFLHFEEIQVIAELPLNSYRSVEPQAYKYLNNKQVSNSSGCIFIFQSSFRHACCLLNTAAHRGLCPAQFYTCITPN